MSIIKKYYFKCMGALHHHPSQFKSYINIWVHLKPLFEKYYKLCRMIQQNIIVQKKQIQQNIENKLITIQLSYISITPNT